MDNVFATVAERYDGDRRILDASEHRLKSSVHIARQHPRHIRGCGHHQAISDQGFLVAGLAKTQLEAGRSCLGANRNAKDFCAETQLRSQFLCKYAYQSSASVAKTEQRWTLARTFPRFGGSHHAADHAAGGFLGIIELREGAAQTEAFRIAGVNSGDERGYKAIQEFGAELPAHECGYGLINFRSAGGAECVARYLPLGGW